MITINKVRSHAGLYHKYPGQTSSQSCYVELDCERRTLCAEYDSEIGGAVPMRVHHGHIQRWSIPCLTADSANDLLDDLTPYMERICDGYESVWDGSNHVARFSTEATGVIESVEDLCYRVLEWADELCVWDAGDYLDSCSAEDLGLSAETTDEELEAIEQDLFAEAAGEGYHVVGIYEVLEKLVHNLRTEE